MKAKETAKEASESQEIKTNPAAITAVVIGAMVGGALIYLFSTPFVYYIGLRTGADITNLFGYYHSMYQHLHGTTFLELHQEYTRIVFTWLNQQFGIVVIP